jgi:hypothetical protein
MTTKRNQTHTFIVSGRTDAIAVIAGMLLSLGTTGARAPKPGRPKREPGNDCIRFDDQGDNNVTIVWRKRDCWAVSFRHEDRSPETEEYRSAWDAAEAVELGYHPGTGCSGLTPAPDED